MEPQIQADRPLPGRGRRGAGRAEADLGPGAYRASGSRLWAGLSPGSERDPRPWVRGQPWLLWPRKLTYKSARDSFRWTRGAPLLHQLRRAAGQPGVSLRCPPSGGLRAGTSDTTRPLLPPARRPEGLGFPGDPGARAGVEGGQAVCPPETHKRPYPP